MESKLNNNKCLLCNIKDNYYPIFNDIINNYSYINCYNETPEGYFFDNNNYIYKPCYPTCKSCFGEGSIINNNFRMSFKLYKNRKKLFK